MKKILFLTNRNIITTSGELRLIKNRAEELYNKYNIATDFIAYQKLSRIHSGKKEAINAGGSICAYAFSILHPLISLFSFMTIKRETLKRVKSGNYNMVVISSFMLASLAKKIRGICPDIPIIMDLHGAAEDTLELAKVSNLRKKIYFHIVYYFIVHNYRKYYRYATGSMVVTRSLEDYVRKNFIIPKIFKFYIIPCATSSYVADTDNYLINRKQYRAKYNIADDELAFVYSGGVSVWQCVEETIDLYKKLSLRLNRKAKMLVFSHNIDKIRAIAGDDQSIITDCHSADELSKALTAGDYAFLLRKDCITNNVAFPNKFLEYVQSGMRIITTPYVHEIYNQVKENDLGDIYMMDGNIDELVCSINNYAIGTNFKEETINGVLAYNSFSQRLSQIVTDIR